MTDLRRLLVRGGGPGAAVLRQEGGRLPGDRHHRRRLGAGFQPHRDHTGNPRTLADFRGRAVLLFFGYTHCPDVCPTTLAKMAQAVDRLGKGGQRAQGLFVTLDPARDTAEVLARYVPALHPSFIGLRGSEAELARTAEDFKLFFARQAPDATGFYTVDHQAAIFAFDPEGRLRLYFRGDSGPEVIAHDLRRLVQP